MGNYLSALKFWINQSNANYNFVIGIGMLLILIASVIQIALIRHYKNDFKNHISIETGLLGSMLISSLVWDMYLTSLFSWQMNFLLKYSLVLLVGSLFLVIHPLWSTVKRDNSDIK